MKFTETELAGAFLIELEPSEDERGFFARTFCRKEFEERGLVTDFVQSSISFNKKKGTLRGMHFQAPPHDEVKLARCTRGSVYDVIVDLRPASPTFKHWTALELSADNRWSLYIPKGFAHGFLTFEDNSELLYMISEPYHPESARGVRWDDPAFGIAWPFEPAIISNIDKSYPEFLATSFR
ncbi:MAG: dTDP-4-dehydrorhamnose 3,5-epimerase [Deltaproteobacteria bacterium]|nr:dTDP-4-dehydrorhamnose 3,5-epimerase [Deltaproteobacteria bacterium]